MPAKKKNNVPPGIQGFYAGRHAALITSSRTKKQQADCEKLALSVKTLTNVSGVLHRFNLDAKDEKEGWSIVRGVAKNLTALAKGK